MTHLTIYHLFLLQDAGYNIIESNLFGGGPSNPKDAYIVVLVAGRLTNGAGKNEIVYDEERLRSVEQMRRLMMACGEY